MQLEHDFDSLLSEEQNTKRNRIYKTTVGAFIFF